MSDVKIYSRLNVWERCCNPFKADTGVDALTNLDFVQERSIGRSEVAAHVVHRKQLTGTQQAQTQIRKFLLDKSRWRCQIAPDVNASPIIAAIIIIARQPGQDDAA